MASYALFPTQLGECGIAWRSDVVVATQLPEETPAVTAARLSARAGATTGDPPRAVRDAIRSIEALLGGERTDLSFVACDMRGASPFEAKVYAITREIAAGETRTYGDIASRLGDKQLARSVGTALSRNPLPIIVPCHRVIGANDRLVGFSASGGVATKRRMLAIEGARTGGHPDLFDDLRR